MIMKGGLLWDLKSFLFSICLKKKMTMTMAKEPRGIMTKGKSDVVVMSRIVLVKVLEICHRHTGKWFNRPQRGGAGARPFFFWRKFETV